MKKRIILSIAMTLSFAGFVQAQDVVTLTGFPALKYAVARQYTPSQSIYYCEDKTDHFFVFYDIGNPTAAIVAQFPSYLDLKEFEVYDDTVYFCGTFPQTGNPYGFVGQISVFDLFFNNGPYNFGLIDHIQQPTCPPNPHMTACDRMDVFRDGPYVHLAIVGEIEHTPYYGTTLRRTACDAWFNGSNWVGQVLFQKEDLYKTNDITCTGNYVVVTAYDDDINYSIILVFNKTSYFPSFPTVYSSFRITDRRLDNNILVERLRDNDVAICHYFQNQSTGEYGTAVHYINDVLTLPIPLSQYSLHYVHGNGTPISVLRDLRCNPNGTKSPLLLLHDIDNPLWSVPTSTIFDFNAYNLPSLLAQAWRAHEDVDFFSVDNRVHTPLFSLAGSHNLQNEPAFTLNDSGLQMCFEPTQIKYNDATAKFSLGEFDRETLVFSVPFYQFFYPYPTEYSIEKKCEE